jgi:hypothetical protein
MQTEKCLSVFVLLILSAVLASASATSLPARVNLLPNPGFETGAGRPNGWRLTDGPGQWGDEARTGRRCLVAQGNGTNQSVWRSDGLALDKGKLYRLTFWGRRDAGAGGTAVAGPAGVNRDFTLSEQWQSCSFIFCQPTDPDAGYIRLGQWRMKAPAYFDDVELAPVLAVHARTAGEVELGEGESIRDGIYRCRLNLAWQGSNFHRTLAKNRAGFNSDRWLFSPGAFVVYRHCLPEHTQKGARVRVAINYQEGGALKIEASRNARDWRVVKILATTERDTQVELPAELFPAPEVFVRLAHADRAGNFQVNAYDYEAELTGPMPDAEGATRFVDVLHENPAVAVALNSFRGQDGSGRGEFQLTVSNTAPKSLSIRAGIAEPDKFPALPKARTIELGLGQTETLKLPFQFGQAGARRCLLVLQAPDDTLLWAGQTTVRVGFLNDQSFGYRLAGLKGLEAWWCESGWKVGRDRALPSRRQPQAVTLSAARGEYEAAQVVLRPEQDTELTAVRVLPMQDAQGTVAPISVSLNEVAYVYVEHPTDSVGWRDWFPDPLPPLQTPLTLRAGQNQPVWITFHVSTEAQPGDYRGALELQTTAGAVRVPLAVHVYNFTLPKETHLRSALGLSTHSINRYHRPATHLDREAVYEQYLQNLADHRISPYSFFAYAPIDIRFEGEGAAKRARVDFTKFDATAEKWLSTGRFNSFLLPLRGMGGGTFHSRHLGELEGFKEGTPEHARLFGDYLGQVERHLRQKGWLKHAYTYWFDEPEPKDYEFVVAGLKRLKAAAPDIKRLLTEQPEPELIGHVDIWCGLTPQWTRPVVQARKAAGEEVWWYICTGPKAPYVTEFIDHPGLELRLWPWQSWQFGVTGILIWETLYWTSDLVFPSPRLQDPWRDPMSYVTGYGRPVGHVGYWGNGDGRFLYPPRRDPNTATTPNLAEPINSLRWENLRDGLEDYEYFWLLQQAIHRAKADSAKAKLVEEAQSLLEIPSEISQDLTHFSTDPRLLLRHRDRLAQMLEQIGMSN